MTPLTDEHGWGGDTETAHQEGLTGSIEGEGGIMLPEGQRIPEGLTRPGPREGIVWKVDDEHWDSLSRMGKIQSMDRWWDAGIEMVSLKGKIYDVEELWKELTDTPENRACWDLLKGKEGTMEDRKDQPIKEDPRALDSLWAEALKILKDLSRTRGLLAVPLVRKDQDLLKLLIYWSKIPMGRAIKQPPPDSQGLSEGELEASLDSWAWRQVTPTLSRLKKLMDHDSVKETRDLMNQGRSLSLIYPDGTVNARVLTVLVSSEQEGIIDLVEKLKGKGD